jgi:hypothetical protein
MSLCVLTAVDPHVTAFLGMTGRFTLLGMTVVVIARVARPVAISLFREFRD